jgi:hypothetical protein
MYTICSQREYNTDTIQKISLLIGSYESETFILYLLLITPMGFKSILENGIALLGLAVMAYASGMGVAKAYYYSTSKQINSQAGLEAAVAEELPRYQNGKDITLIPIYDNPRLDTSEAKGLSWKVGEDTYEISATNQGSVKHELEHIYGGDLEQGNLPERQGSEKVLGYFLYWTFYEPRATLAGLGVLP